jgi:hypothetical protein
MAIVRNPKAVPPGLTAAQTRRRRRAQRRLADLRDAMSGMSVDPAWWREQFLASAATDYCEALDALFVPTEEANDVHDDDD